MKKMMGLADSHMHLFATGYPGRYGALFPRGRELEVYQAMRSSHHISKSLVVGYEAEAWARGNNRYIARLAQEDAWMVPLAFCPSATSPSEKQIALWWQQGFSGISLYLSEKADLESVLSWSEETLAAINERRAILSINIPLKHMKALLPFARRLSEARILLSHLGLPGHVRGKISEGSARRRLSPLLALSELPQVGVKISAFYACNDYPHHALSPMVAAVAEHFGPKRLYWGSDYSPALDFVSFAQSLDAARFLLPPSVPFSGVLSNNLTAVMARVRR